MEVTPKMAIRRTASGKIETTVCPACGADMVGLNFPAHLHNDHEPADFGLGADMSPDADPELVAADGGRTQGGQTTRRRWGHHRRAEDDHEPV